jgi:apolipoprotein N-acyltransferase
LESVILFLLVVLPTVVLLGMSFPGPDLPLLAWVALVPWLLLIGSGTARAVALVSWLIGIVFFTVKLSWLGYATNAGWLLLSAYLSLFFLVFGLSCAYIYRNLSLPLALIAPFLWVSLEYLRGVLLTGFPWFYLGHTQYSYLPIIQISDITGAYGVSFVIVAANACFTQGLLRWWVGKGGHFLFAIAFIFLLFPLSYGVFRLAGLSYQEGPRLCMIQGNILQDLKMHPDPEQRKKNLQKYLDMSRKVGAGTVDLVVWPETAVPGLLNLAPRLCRETDRFAQSAVSELARDLQSHLLVGGIAIEPGEGNSLVGAGFKPAPTFYNSAFLYGPDGNLLDRYDKLHLVPFGEYTPLKRIFPFLRYMVPYEIDLSPGGRGGVTTPLLEFKGRDQKGFRFATLICYEDTVPSLARYFAREGADFLLNITNDGWFHDTPELDQHLAIMVFRAVENRIGMARAANTGISAFVAPSGDIYSLVNQDGRRREVEGILEGTILITKEGPTFYTRYGDLFSQFCLIVSIGLLLAPTVRRYYPGLKKG